MTTSQRLRGVALFVGVAAGGALGGAALVGAHGGDATKIHACVEDARGPVRIVSDPTPYGDPNEACEPDEHALDWSVQGPQGPPGAQGPQGPQGPAGGLPPGIATGVDAFSSYKFADVRTVVEDSGLNADNKKTVVAKCPPLHVAVSGGYDLYGMLTGRLIGSSYPSQNGWRVEGFEAINIAGTEPWGVTAYAVCIGQKPSKPTVSKIKLKKLQARKPLIESRRVFPKR